MLKTGLPQSSSTSFIFQWPPLSGPTRSIFPAFFNSAICFSIAFTETPVESASSSMVTEASADISASIFSLLFSLLFSLPLWAVFRIVCAETLTDLKSVTVKIETVQNSVSGKKALTFLLPLLKLLFNPPAHIWFVCPYAPGGTIRFGYMTYSGIDERLRFRENTPWRSSPIMATPTAG